MLQVIKWDDHPDPSLHFDFATDIWKGLLKSAMKHAFSKSSESSTILQVRPEQTVFVTKAFKPGAMKLVPLSNNIALAMEGSKNARLHQADKNIELGVVFVHNKQNVVGVVRSHLNQLKKEKASGFAADEKVPFIAKFWGIKSTDDSAKVNTVFEFMDVSIKVAGIKHDVKVPTLTNTVHIPQNGELFMKNANKLPLDAPDPKRARLLAPHGASSSGKGGKKGGAARGKK